MTPPRFRFIAALIIALAFAIVALAGCSSKSSPTEPDKPQAATASLSGWVRVTGYSGGTLTVVDMTGAGRVATLNASDGTFSYGSVFVPGPYDVYLDKVGQRQQHVAMHGQDSSSPILHAGANQFFWLSLFERGGAQ